MFALVLLALLDLTAASGAPGAVVEARWLGVRRGKPPLAWHRFDVVLRNPSSQPRWMVLPSAFPYSGRTDPAPGSGSVAELQIFRLGPGALFVKAIGGEFQSLKLPAHGSVTLRALSIEAWWANEPPTVALEVLVARSVTIGGVALEKLVGPTPAGAAAAEVKVPWDLSGQPDVAFWHPAKDQPAPVALDVESRARTLVPLSLK